MFKEGKLNPWMDGTSWLVECKKADIEHDVQVERNGGWCCQQKMKPSGNLWVCDICGKTGVRG
jgi:hypothetical protein